MTQPVQLETVGAGVDLGGGVLQVSQILGFDDLGNLALAVADHPADVLDEDALGGQHGHSVALLQVPAGQELNGVRLD